MHDLIPSLGCLSLAFLVLPVWAVREARRSRRDSAETRDTVFGLSKRIDLLENRLMDLRRELRGGAAVAPEPAQTPERELERPGEAAPPPIPETMAQPEFFLAPPPPPAPATVNAPPATPLAARQAPPPAPTSSPFDWESMISVRAFAWLGGAALFLGAVLFLQYSIQHGLIPPPARVAIGLVVGSLALVWGDSLRARSMLAGQATSGAGVAVLYATLFAAHTRYHLLGTTATFAAMGLVTLVAGLLAVRRNAFILAVLGLFGGFLTPYLLATNEDHPIGLLAYVLLLDAGVLAVARKRAWVSLSLLGLAGSALLYGGWAAAHLDAEKLPWALAAAVILGALFIFGAANEETAPHEKDLARATPLAAALAPLVVAIVTSGNSNLAVSPVFLVLYLLILAGQAFFVSRRLDAEALVPLAAVASMLCLVLRTGSDLFPQHRGTTLALYVLLPAAFVLIWVFSRKSKQELALRFAAGAALFGSFVVLLRVLGLEPKPEPVLALWLYAAVHAAGILVLGAMLLSGAWILAAQGYLFASLLALTTRFESARFSEFLPLVLVPIAVFWILPFLSARLRADHLAWISAGIAPIAHFAVLYVLARSAWGTDWLGLASVVLGALAFIALRRAMAMQTDPAERRFTAAIFGSVTLLFLTAAIPILLDKQWITVAWALEAAALAWLSTRVRESGLVKASAALAVATFARLVLNPALWHYHPRGDTPIFNWYLYTFGIPVVAFLAAARWIRDDATALELRYPEVLRLFAGVLLFVLLNVEIADFYSTGQTLDFRLSGGGLAQDLTYSLAWGIFALGLLALGITRSSKAVRAAALGVLLLTIGKVFLHDLWDLGALYRVASIVGLAIALLAVSFLTQRYVFSRERP